MLKTRTNYQGSILLPLKKRHFSTRESKTATVCLPCPSSDSWDSQFWNYESPSIWCALCIRGLRGMGHTVAQLAEELKVAGSIPDGAIGTFHWHHPSGCTNALRTIQPLTEKSTRNIFWSVRTAGAYGWQP